MIDVKNLHKYFGSLEVLKGIDCHIDKGECVCVIGPSGSGKSTFLRCLNLLETPTKGDIVIDDMHLTEKDFDVDAMRKRVGMVFQHFNLFPHLTILENVTLAPIRHKMMTEEQAKEKAIEMFKIAADMGNVLETVTIPNYPVIDEIKKHMLSNGAVGAMMSGSGPTVFGLFDDEDTAKKAYKAMRSSHLARQVYLTSVYNNRK